MAITVKQAPTMLAYRDSGTGSPELVPNHQGAPYMYLSGQIAGERQPGSTLGADYSVMAGEWATTAAIAAGTGAVIYAGPCILHGVWVETTIGTAAPTVTDGGIVRRTIPVALPIGYHQLGDIIMQSNAVCVAGASATGSIRFDFRPLDPRVTWAY